jgi:twitching motility protein PilT
MNGVDFAIKTAAEKNASDVHIENGLRSAVVFRILGKLVQSEIVVAQEDVESWLSIVMTKEAQAELLERGSADFAYAGEDLPRCRVNVYLACGKKFLAVRLLKNALPAWESLHLPKAFDEILAAARGLILIGGKAGAGKSTTADVILERINERGAKKIITLEEPVEHIFKNKRSYFSQRELGRDFFNFADAVRATLRQDADIVFVGELRDREGAASALNAAETGKLVLATVHSGSAAQALERLIAFFSGEQQAYVRFQLAAVLKSVIVQKLLTSEDETRQIPVQEILLATAAVANLIRENKLNQLYNQIQLGQKLGMQTFEGSIKRLAAFGIRVKEGGDGII